MPAHGDTGVVCSTWFNPNPVYEVEFRPAQEPMHIRVLIVSDRFRLIEKSVLQTQA